MAFNTMEPDGSRPSKGRATSYTDFYKNATKSGDEDKPPVAQDEFRQEAIRRRLGVSGRKAKKPRFKRS